MAGIRFFPGDERDGIHQPPPKVTGNVKSTSPRRTLILNLLAGIGPFNQIILQLSCIRNVHVVDRHEDIRLHEAGGLAGSTTSRTATRHRIPSFTGAVI